MRYQVKASRFHGNGLISEHRSLKAAMRKVLSYRKQTDCICGCMHVIDTLNPEVNHHDLKYIVDSNQVENYESSK